MKISNSTACSAAVLLTIALSAQGQSQASGPLRGLIQTGEPRVGDELSAADQARADVGRAAWERRKAASGIGSYDNAPGLIPQFPIGATLDRDTYPGLLVDDQFGPGMFDFNCTSRCYDGHAGIDAGLRSFAEQAIGVPVFAALDGYVSFTQDGNPDMNTIPQGQPANLVFIDNGSGVESEYYHLKLNSVAVSVGQFVRAGEFIGFAASSGNSAGPHLHFELHRHGVVFDPSAGTCNPIASSWANQQPISYALNMWDFGYSRTDLTGLYPPAILPRTGQYALSDGPFFPWIIYTNLPANSTYHVQFQRPNGTIAYDSGTWPLNNPTTYLSGMLWFGFDIADMHTITGTWRMLLDLNAQQVIDAPLEVVTVYNPNFNRPPEPITVSFDPPAPTTGDVVYTRVNTSQVLDDLDYDVVRYHYVWKVNGVIVRDVTTAGQADALPHHSALAGDVLSCNVTPSDGVASGPTAGVNATLTTGCSLAFTYCTPKVNSLGCSPRIECFGSPSASATSGFTISARYVHNLKTGLLLHGVNGRASTVFQGGTLCENAPLKRTPPVTSGGSALPASDCSGVYSIDMNAFAHGLLGGTPLLALKTLGTTVDCQWWGRDQGFPVPNNSTLSDGLEYSVCP